MKKRFPCGETAIKARATMKPPGHKILVVNVVVVGPFEEEEEGTGIASDVVEVEGEDPVTPGEYLRSVDARTPRDRNDSPILGNKTKQHRISFVCVAYLTHSGRSC